MSAILTVTDLVKTFTLHAVGGRTVTSLAGVSLHVDTPATVLAQHRTELIDHVTDGEIA